MDILEIAVLIGLLWIILCPATAYIIYNFNWLKKQYKKYRCRHIMELALDDLKLNNYHKWLNDNIDKNKWTIEYPFRSTFWEDVTDEIYIFRFKTKEDLIAFKLGCL